MLHTATKLVVCLVHLNFHVVERNTEVSSLKQDYSEFKLALYLFIYRYNFDSIPAATKYVYLNCQYAVFRNFVLRPY